MGDYRSPLGTLSSGGHLLGDTGGGPTPPPRRRWVPVLVIAVIAVVALVMVAGAAVLLLSGDDASDDPPAARTGPAGTEDHADERTVAPERPSEPAETPAAPRERPSLLSATGTAEALTKIRAGADGRKAMTLRIDPDRVTAIVKGRVLTYSKDGRLQDLPGPPTTPVSFDLGDVEASAPSRIDQAIRAKRKQVEYVVYVVNPVTEDVGWTIVTKDGKNYSADPSGRRLCRLALRC